jgi:hypothetical protein
MRNSFFAGDASGKRGELFEEAIAGFTGWNLAKEQLQ